MPQGLVERVSTGKHPLHARGARRVPVGKRLVEGGSVVEGIIEAHQAIDAPVPNDGAVHVPGRRCRESSGRGRVDIVANRSRQEGGLVGLEASIGLRRNNCRPTEGENDQEEPHLRLPETATFAGGTRQQDSNKRALASLSIEERCSTVKCEVGADSEVGWNVVVFLRVSRFTTIPFVETHEHLDVNAALQPYNYAHRVSAHSGARIDKVLPVI
jgi:hypothetical protein